MSIKKIIIAGAVSLGIMSLFAGYSVGAVDILGEACANGASSTKVCEDVSNAEAGGENIIKSIINILLFLLAAIAVIVIVISGIVYTTSGGNTSQVSTAKNMLLYAIVGLVVAILAYAIVNFVVLRTQGGGGVTTSIPK